MASKEDYSLSYIGSSAGQPCSDDEDDDHAYQSSRTATVAGEESSPMREAANEMASNAVLFHTAEQEVRALEADLERLENSTTAFAADVAHTRIDLEVKKRELNVTCLHHRKLRANLEAVHAREAYKLADMASDEVVKQTREVHAELERIKLYVTVIKSSSLGLSDPNRRYIFQNPLP